MWGLRLCRPGGVSDVSVLPAFTSTAAFTEWGPGGRGGARERRSGRRWEWAACVDGVSRRQRRSGVWRGLPALTAICRVNVAPPRSDQRRAALTAHLAVNAARPRSDRRRAALTRGAALGLDALGTAGAP